MGVTILRVIKVLCMFVGILMSNKVPDKLASYSCVHLILLVI
jgi:hypothetical protein